MQCLQRAPVLGVIAVLAATPVTAQSTGPTAFGFVVGEERRYVEGPPEQMPAGEFAQWTIRLVRIEGQPPNERISFHLGYEAQWPSPWQMTPPNEELERSHAEVRLVVNRAGYPLRLSFEHGELVDHRGVHGAVSRRNEITWGDGDFLWAAAWGPDTDVVFRIPLPRSGSLELSVPRGVFVHTGGRRSFSLADLRNACAGPRPNPLHVEAFENPGLLSLLFAALSEAPGGERDFVLFAPRQERVVPCSPVGASADVSGHDLDRLRDTGRSISQPPPDRYPNFRELRLRLAERTRVSLGGREREAWRATVEGNLGDVYFDPADGRVLRVDLGSSSERHIRLLAPHEY